MLTTCERLMLLAVAVLAAFCTQIAPASAQATRTWVSGVGDDVNPCSRTAPCKTFAGAISKTASGGEINCLDPGGFGTLTITKSITVDCVGTMGSTLNSGGINGLVINDSATGTPGTIEVILKNLSVNGAGTTPGLNGIRFVSGSSLTVENVIVQNQSNAGIDLAPSSAIRLHVINSTFVNVGSGSTGSGIRIKPTGVGTVNATLDNVRLVSNTGAGLEVDTTGAVGSSSNVSVIRGTFASSLNGISVIGPNGTPGAVVTVLDSLITSNITNGLLVTGPTAAIRVGSSMISSNTRGLLSSGGTLISFGDNVLAGNGTNGSFAGVLPLQ